MTTRADLENPWLSGQARVDALLWQNINWNYVTPADPVITYTFSLAGTEIDPLRPASITALTPAQEAAAREVIGKAAAISGISFVELADGGTADIHFANGDLRTDVIGVTNTFQNWWMEREGSMTEYAPDAYIYFDNVEFAEYFANPTAGTLGYYVFLHEVGHALGLKHPHEGISLPPGEDSSENTVMSYNVGGSPPGDYQEYDIAALEWLYGGDGLGGLGFGGVEALTLTGTAGNDQITGGGGSDTIDGGDGDDTLIGGARNDVLRGGAGVDSMNGGDGGDTYYVTAGDVLTDPGGTWDGVISPVSWTLAAGFENLIIVGDASTSAIGNASNNRVAGNTGNDTVIGLGGNDELFGWFGDDFLDGGAGNDILFAGPDDDVFAFSVAPGPANADFIVDFGWDINRIVLDGAVHPNLGAAGAFSAGDARFYAAPGANTAHDADDRVIYNATTGELWYDADGSGSGSALLIATLGDRFLLNATHFSVVAAAAGGQTINGTSGNDTLSGTAGNDTINGLGGNDVILAGSTGGADVIDGGAGSDSIEFKERATGAIVVDYRTGTITGSGSGSISFTGIERVVAGIFNDVLNGDGAAQNLTGQGGMDTLWGGGAVDTLWGGGGNDTFLFREMGTANADRVSDFASGQDKILLDATAFTALGAAGNFAAGDSRFVANGTGSAQDSSDRVIFNTSTRELWYDADGNGAGARQLIATLQSGAPLVATDIAVAAGTGGPVNGTAGNDSIVGTEGSDTINGLAGNDTLRGLGGDDVLDGGADADTMDGGLGNDTFHVTAGDVLSDAGGIDTVISAAADNGSLPDEFEHLTITGDGGSLAFGNLWANRIDASARTTRIEVDGSAGNDTIIGGSGNDELRGSGEDDFIVGGAGNDALDPFGDQHGSDTLDGGLGDDGFYVDTTEDVLIDAGGNDTVVSNISWTLAAGFENLTFFNHNTDDEGLPGLEGYGNELANRMQTYGGDSGLLDGRAGNDTLIGSDRGADTLTGGTGNDALTGAAGGDRFIFNVAPGTANADQITDFAAASDKIVLDGTVHAGSGPSGDLAAGDARFWSSGSGTAHDADDRVIYNTATGQLWYDADGSGGGAAQLIAILQGVPALTATDIAVINGSAGGSVINGTAGNDTLSGTSGNDTINGLAGNDVILGGSAGNDVVDGGAGSDSIEFKAAATGALTVDFATGTITGSGSVSFTNIERVVAGNFNDVLNGNAVAQNLTGQNGNDTLWGAGGADTLWGGAGNDTFIFREMGTANADRVGDFTSGGDKLQLDDSAFTAIGAIGNFAASDARFWASTTGAAHDANDRVLYNTSTGQLYYDADGSGGGAAQLVATLTTIPSIAATDIQVI